MISLPVIFFRHGLFPLMFRALDALACRVKFSARAEIYYLLGDILPTTVYLQLHKCLSRLGFPATAINQNEISFLQRACLPRVKMVVADALVRRSYLRRKRGAERRAIANLWNIRFGHRLIGGTVTQCSFEAAVSMRWFNGDRSRDWNQVRRVLTNLRDKFGYFESEDTLQRVRSRDLFEERRIRRS